MSAHGLCSRVNKDIPVCKIARTNPMFAVKVEALQLSPVPKIILFFIAIFLEVGRLIRRSEGLFGVILFNMSEVSANRPHVSQTDAKGSRNAHS